MNCEIRDFACLSSPDFTTGDRTLETSALLKIEQHIPVISSSFEYFLVIRPESIAVVPQARVGQIAATFYTCPVRKGKH